MVSCLCARVVLTSDLRLPEASGREEGAVESLREPEPGFQQHPLALEPTPSLAWSSRWGTSRLEPASCRCCQPHLGTRPFRDGRLGAGSWGRAACWHSHWQIRQFHFLPSYGCPLNSPISHLKCRGHTQACWCNMIWGQVQEFRVQVPVSI